MLSNEIQQTGFGFGSSHHCLQAFDVPAVDSMFSRWLPHDDVGGHMPFWEANRDSPCTFKVFPSLIDWPAKIISGFSDVIGPLGYIYKPSVSPSKFPLHQTTTHIYFTHISTTTHIYFPSPPTQKTLQSCLTLSAKTSPPKPRRRLYVNLFSAEPNQTKLALLTRLPRLPTTPSPLPSASKRPSLAPLTVRFPNPPVPILTGS